MFTLTYGTAAWSARASPLLEIKTTLLAQGWFHNKALVMYRLLDMHEMIENFFFFDPEQFRNLSQVQKVFSQCLSNLLPQSGHSCFLNNLNTSLARLKSRIKI